VNNAPAALAVFAVTYFLASGVRIRGLPASRPAGALLGAVLMVVLGVLTPDEAYGTINFDTLALLLGTMVLSEFLKRAGFYDLVAARIAASGLGAHGLLFALVVVAGLLSAVLVNDTICLMLTPFVISILRAARLPLVPFLLALATSSNIGSALTLTGNPQVMIVATHSGIPYMHYLGVVAIPVLLSLAANYALLRWVFRAQLRAAPAREGSAAAAVVDPALLVKSLCCLGLAVVGFALSSVTGINLAWTALACATLLLVIGRRDPYEIFGGVDWTLLLFFAGLFVVVGGVAKTGILAEAQSRFVEPLLVESTAMQTIHLSWITIAGCQVFSNVPFVLVTAHWIPSFAEPQLAWTTLAYVSTVAGNLTILGSVANLIVLEQARAHVKIGFFEYLRFGALTTAASAVLGVLILLLEHGLGWI
jgi:Na+/H+ antiporter NhaD/arsenite permease-like protein